MKRNLTYLLLAEALTAAAADKPKSKAAPKPAPAPITIPAAATRVDANTFRYTDAKGKKWIYKQTPFGVVRMEEDNGAAAAIQKPAPEPTAVTITGDTVHFERKTPFGATSWDRKKAELTDEERGIVERSEKTKSE